MVRRLRFGGNRPLAGFLGGFRPFWEVGGRGGHGNRSSGHFGFSGRFRAPYIVDISFKGAKNNNPRKSKDKEK